MNTEYHKIQSIFKRDMESRAKTLIEGAWTLPEFEYLAGNMWTFTEKVDGTNIRVAFDGENVTFGGRTDAAQIPTTLIERLRQLFATQGQIETMKSVFASSDVVMYGEGYGAKIQKGGGNYLPHQDFVLFDVRIGQWWLQRADVVDIAVGLGLKVVPVIGEGTLHDAVAWAKHGILSMWGDFQAEGIVVRPKTELNTRSGHRLIAKIKCRDFAPTQD